jgi:hypothetical protein
MAEGDEAPLPCQGRGLERTSLDSEHPTVSALDDLDQLELGWLCAEFDRQERDQEQDRSERDAASVPSPRSPPSEDRRPWTVLHALAVIRQWVLQRGGTHRGSLGRLCATTGWSRRFTYQTLELWQHDDAITFSIDGDALTITILQRPATLSAPSSPGPEQGSTQRADSKVADHDPSAASEAIDGPIGRNHVPEMLLAIQRSELRAFFSITLGRHARTIDLDKAIENAGVDLNFEYDRRELGKLIGMNPAHYARFANEALGRKKAKFPTRIIPGCFSEADAERFRDDKNRPGRTAARQRSRARDGFGRS